MFIQLLFVLWFASYSLVRSGSIDSNRMSTVSQENLFNDVKIIDGNEFDGQPILYYRKPSENQLIHARTLRSDESEIIGKQQTIRDRSIDKYDQGFKLSIGSAGFAVLAMASLLFLIMILIFMYIQQRNENQQLAKRNDDSPQHVGNESNNSHVSEAKQLLKNRLYVVKRYIPCHFDNGLPCPEKNEAINPNISPSSSGLISVTPAKSIVQNPQQQQQQQTQIHVVERRYRKSKNQRQNKTR